MKSSQTFDLSTDYADVYYEDGILYTILNDKRNETLDMVKAHMVKALKVFEKKLPAPNLVTIGVSTQSSKEVRTYIASDEMKKICTATAIVMTNKGLASMIGNLFLKIHKPTYPTSFFSKKEKAIAWLQQHKKTES